jgi:hypothetical protein
MPLERGSSRVPAACLSITDIPPGGSGLGREPQATGPVRSERMDRPLSFRVCQRFPHSAKRARPPLLALLLGLKPEQIRGPLPTIFPTARKASTRAPSCLPRGTAPCRSGSESGDHRVRSRASRWFLLVSGARLNQGRQWLVEPIVIGLRLLFERLLFCGLQDGRDIAHPCPNIVTLQT